MIDIVIPRKTLRKVLIFILCFGLTVLSVWIFEKLEINLAQKETQVANLVKTQATLSNEPISPIPLKIELDEAKVELGNLLFHDKRLSTNDTVSCATCHLLNKGGTDRLETSFGMMGANTGLNSPTVYNSGFQFNQFWDGRAKTLEEQALGPIEAAKEMGGLNWPQLIDKLKQSPEYIVAFKEIYNRDISKDDIVDAIATFERSLYTPNAPFDLYLKGNKNAIPIQAKQGYELFKSYGCVTCHQGMLVGGNMFQSLGVFGDYFGACRA